MVFNDTTNITNELIDIRYAIASMPGHREMLDSLLEDIRRAVRGECLLRQAWFIRDRFKELMVLPACFIWGEDDRSAPLSPWGFGLKDLRPDLPFHVIKGAGHIIQSDKPDECNRILLSHFLGEKMMLDSESIKTAHEAHSFRYE